MSHHSKEPLSPEMAERMQRLFGGPMSTGQDIAAKEAALRKKLEEAEDLGATGKFPEGILTRSDEGEIRFAVARTGDRVVLDFGSPVAWIGFGGQQAVEIGRLLVKRGREALKATPKIRSPEG